LRLADGPADGILLYRKFRNMQVAARFRGCTCGNLKETTTPSDLSNA
jgi:hypothetical protein